MNRIPRTQIDVFPLNLGGNTFGWTSDTETSSAVLDAFVAAGGNFIDTADSYSVWAGTEAGASEGIIGDWMQQRGNREQIVIATKVGALPERKGLEGGNIEAALTDSLRRLKTDYIDLYYLHYDDDSVAIADQVRTMHSLVESGRIRHIGLSNFSSERMREWFETATREGLSVPVAIQPLYNLVARQNYEQHYAPLATEFEVAVFPYSALASGFLTGKYRTQEDVAEHVRGGSAKTYLNTDGLTVVDALVETADSHGVEPATVALAWLLARGITAPIASVSEPAQLASLLAAAELQLSAAELERLNAASQPFS